MSESPAWLQFSGELAEEPALPGRTDDFSVLIVDQANHVLAVVRVLRGGINVSEVITRQGDLPMAHALDQLFYARRYAARIRPEYDTPAEVPFTVSWMATAFPLLLRGQDAGWRVSRAIAADTHGLLPLGELVRRARQPGPTPPANLLSFCPAPRTEPDLGPGFPG